MDDGSSSHNEVQARQAVRQRLAERSAERIKELQAANPDLPQDFTGHVPAPSPRSSKKPTMVRYAVGVALVITLNWGALLGVKGFVDGAGDRQRNQPMSVTMTATKRAGQLDETEAVTLCDLNMQAQTVAQSSYRGDWSWQIERRDGLVAVRRGFAVKNLLGVELNGKYVCLIGEEASRLVGLQYDIGGQTVTVPGSELQS